MDLKDMQKEFDERARKIHFKQPKKRAFNIPRRQEKEDMISLGYKTRKAYLKALKKERIRRRNEQLSDQS